MFVVDLSTVKLNKREREISFADSREMIEVENQELVVLQLADVD